MSYLERSSYELMARDVRAAKRGRASMLFCAAILAASVGVVAGCRRSTEEPPAQEEPRAQEEQRALEEQRLQSVPQADPVRPRRVSFAPNEPVLLIVESNGLVGLWKTVAANRPMRTAWIPAGAIDACFTPDGEGVLTAGWDGKLRRWTTNGRLVWTTKEGHNGPARALAVGGDRIVSGGEDGKLRFWTLDGAPGGKPVDARVGYVVSIALGPRGEVAVSGSDDVVRMWRGDALEQANVDAQVLFQGSSDQIQYLEHRLGYDPMGWDHALSFAPGGQALAGATFYGGVHIWRAPDWNDAVTLESTLLNRVRALAYSPDGQLLAVAGFNGMVTVWNADGSKRLEIDGRGRPIVSVAFSPAGDRLITAGVDDRVRVWSVNGLLVAELPKGEQDRIGAFALGHGEPLFAVADSKSGTVGVWRLESIEPQIASRGPSGILALAFGDGNDELFGGGRDCKVRRWGLDRTSAVIDTDFGFWIDGVLPSPDGKFVVASGSPGTLQLLSLDGSSRRVGFRPCGEVVQGMQFSGDGHKIALLCEKGEAKWTTLDGASTETILPASAGAARGLVLLSDGTVVSGALDGTLRRWRPSGEPAGEWHVGLSIDQVGAFRGEVWVRANGDVVTFFDAAGVVATLLLRTDGWLAFTPDGWFSGSNGAAENVGIFRDDGTPLGAAQNSARYNPAKVLRALRDG